MKDIIDRKSTNFQCSVGVFGGLVGSPFDMINVRWVLWVSVYVHVRLLHSNHTYAITLCHSNHSLRRMQNDIKLPLDKRRK